MSTPIPACEFPYMSAMQAAQEPSSGKTLQCTPVNTESQNRLNQQLTVSKSRNQASDKN